MSLMKRFYQDRYLHIRSFTVNATISIGLCIAAYAVHAPGFYRFTPAMWQLALVPLGMYAGGLSAVFIHNATHNSFPTPWLNWCAGQLAGLHQLWGFMGWKLIHLVHHQYSDDTAMDPHPPKNLSYWQFTKCMFLESSAKISERYREHWGLTKRTKFLHRAVLVTFFILSMCNLLFWFLLLGPVGFLFFYIPSYITNHLLFSHINYYAHPKNEQGATEPSNLDHNLYYNIANAIWCGIYYHGNHHRRPALFNPKKMVVTSRDAQPVLEAA
jgi:stearoyl-CoA desaturase (delta-9 desaturase)